MIRIVREPGEEIEIKRRNSGSFDVLIGYGGVHVEISALDIPKVVARLQAIDKEWNQDRADRRFDGFTA